jgi:internalin A
MTPAEAYAESLRRIREVGETALYLDLSKLETLNVLPLELQRLTSLQTLNLSACKRISDLSPLSGMTSLQTLNLSWCEQLTELSPLTGLTSLQTLDLSWCCELGGDLTWLGCLTSLQTLDLSWCYRLRGDLSPLAHLISLQMLNLSGCKQLGGDLSWLEGLSSLQTINLSWCYGLRGELSWLSDLSSLQSLDISACKQFSGDLSPLARLTSLQTLNLSTYEQLDDLISLARLTSLQALDLSKCGQLKDDLSPLQSLTSLQTLDLSECGQLSGGLAPLRNLTSLQTVNLSECVHIRGDLAPLQGLTSLQTLNLSKCGDLSGDISSLAGLNSLQSLDLSECVQLRGDLASLQGLISLQTLNLSKCVQLGGDLSVLADFTSLQTLNLSDCGRITWDLSSLVDLTSLQLLDLSGCLNIREFASLEFLLPRLEVLCLFGCKLNDLPIEVCGVRSSQNVLNKVRAHFADLQFGARRDSELKVLFLGNGGVGKTQLCRRLRGLEFDPNVPTTHGIQLGEITATIENFPQSVRLNLWDFGGQDIYHGSHALFLQGQAVLLILWTSDLERACSYQERGVTLRHRPLSYWLDYVRAFAGVKSVVLVIQSKCDTARHILHPPATPDDFESVRLAAVSAKTDLGLLSLSATIQEAVLDCLNRRPPPPIGAGRLAVRDVLRRMLRKDRALPPTERKHCLLTRNEFDNICAKVGGVSNNEALLDFLLLNGVVFYRSGLFGGRIVLDQNWALEAIYTLFDREKTLPLLRGYGRFTRKELETLIWVKYTRDQQQVFLDMMEGCGICFKLRILPPDHTASDEEDRTEWEYLAPELLPEWSDAQELLFGRLRDDPPDAEASARYAFLHEGVLRGYLSKLGSLAKDAAIYWKYGCWFFEQTTRSQILIESKWDDVETESGAGSIRLRAWGEGAENLIDPMLEALKKLPVGQAPEVKRIVKTRVESSTTLDDLEIPIRHELPSKFDPQIFVSYAWGDDSSEEARHRATIVIRLCETLEKDGWQILRDKTDMHPGDLISGFMKRIGLADHVIVVLSDKYLRSSYCMSELYSIYQRSIEEKAHFLRRIIPLRLPDAQFNTWRDRANYAKHWKAEFEEMKSELTHLGPADFRLYKEMQKWYLDVGEILAHVADVLSPRGFDEIVKDDCVALRRMLRRRIDV